MDPKIVTKKSFTVAGFKYRGKNENQEIPQLWQTYNRRFGQLRHRTPEKIAYGLMDNFDEQSGEFDYVAGTAVSSDKDLPADAVIWEVPEQTYAVFTCTLPTIHETFDNIYSKWLPKSGAKRQPGIEFELYDERFSTEDPDSELDIYIPIQKSG